MRREERRDLSEERAPGAELVEHHPERPDVDRARRLRLRRAAEERLRDLGPARAWFRASIEAHRSECDLNRGRNRGSTGLRARGFVPRSRLITADVTSIEAGIEGAPAAAHGAALVDW